MGIHTILSESNAKIARSTDFFDIPFSSCFIYPFLSGCPGVLVVKRAVLPAQNSLPTEPGGGTVFYVTEEHHRSNMCRE